MVTSPTGKGVIAMGGNTASFEYSKAMFELSASMQWTRLEHTLKIGHCAPLAIPIPDELVYEKVESEELQCSLPENRTSMKNYVVNKFVNFFKLFK